MVLDRLVLGLGLVSAGAILAGAAVTIAYIRADTLRNAEARFADLALVLGEQTARTVHQVDGVLDFIDDHVIRLAREGGTAALSSRAMHDELVHHAGTVPQLLAVAVLDADGAIVSVSNRYPAPAIDNADLEHFTAHRDGRARGFFIGAPFRGRATGRWTVPISRAVRTPSGEFLGVVAAAMNLGYFESLHRQLSLGPSGALRLYRTDGVVLTAHPAAESPAASAPAGEREAIMARAGTRESGVIRERSPAPTLVAFRKLQGFPLIVSVGAPEAEVFAPWRVPAWTLGGLGVGAAVFVLAFAVQLARRLRAERALREEVTTAETRWRLALEGADHGVFDWNLTTGHYYRSPRYLQMLGLGAGETMPEARDARLIHPDDRERMARLDDEVAAGRVGHFSERIRLLRRDGTALPVLFRGLVVERGPDGRAERVLGTLTDVSALEAAQHRLAESEARLNGIVQSALDAVITVDQDARIVLFNAAAERLLGLAADEAIGGPLDRFVPDRVRTALDACFTEFAASGETSRLMTESTAATARRADGTEFPVEGSISRVKVDGRALFTLIMRDISERRRAEAEIARSHAELRALAASMHGVREAERTRIARELHDELGQALTALKMDLEALEARIPLGEGDLFDRTAAMRRLLDFTFATTRRLSADLRPLVLDDLGLGAAAEWLVQNLSQRGRVACDLEIDPALADLGEPQATVLFRVLQESLTNIVRHASATHAHIRLERQGTDAVLTVRDDGSGMDEQAQSKPGSFGLRGIRERVLAVGGEVEISGAPGRGTTLRARVPLAHALQAEREAA